MIDQHIIPDDLYKHIALSCCGCNPVETIHEGQVIYIHNVTEVDMDKLCNLKINNNDKNESKGN